MEKAVLEASIRANDLSAKHLRRQGQIPAQFYGHGVQNLSLALDYQTFRRLYRTAGANTVIDLKVQGDSDRKVLVHQVDHDPVTGEFIHVDFINVRMDEKVTTQVPIVLEGTPPAVRELGGILIQSLDEVEITCFPGDLIHEIVLSADALVDFSSAIHVSDIRVSDKIEILTDPELTIFTVQPPREEEPEEAPAVPGEGEAGAAPAEGAEAAPAAEGDAKE